MQIDSKVVMVVSMNMRVNEDAHWRDSARPMKFFIWDARAAIPMLLVMLHPQWWTLIAAIVAMTFFSLLNRYGFTPMVFLRWLRSTIAGPRKLAVPWWMR